MVYSKSVVLSSFDNSLKKAVLKIESQSGNVSGEVKLYNFKEEPMGVLTLGLFVDGKVQKAGLTRTGYMQYDFGTILTKIPASCTCALISSRGGESEPILMGAINQNSQSIEENILKSLSALNSTSTTEIKQILDENNVIFENQDEIEEEIDKCFVNSLEDNKQKNFEKPNNIFRSKTEEAKCECGGNCEKCEYKNAFYSVENEEEIPQDLKKEITKGKLRVPNKKINFIDEIGGQIDLLFDKYPQEEILCDIIPNSKWVKVDFNNNNKFYVVGLIYEKGEIKYICYGIPAKWSENPPADFNENAQWLPIDLSNPTGKGYWLTYQDAQDGDLIQVNII